MENTNTVTHVQYVITITVDKGVYAGKSRTFTGPRARINASNWQDKVDNQYGAICTTKTIQTI